MVTELSPRRIMLAALALNPLIADDCIAYHGTSLETIEFMLQRGIIPGCTDPQYSAISELPQTGDVYFTPSDNFPLEKLASESVMGILGLDYAISASAACAESIAWGHAFCKYLGIPIGRYSFHASILVEDYKEDNANTRPARAIFATLGISERQLQETVQAARRRKGVIIGLHKSALDVFPISEGDCGDDFRVCTGLNGLPISFLTVVTPLGVEEEHFFKQLQH